MSAAADEVADTLMLLRDEPMAKHTSWRVGGPADVFFKPSTLDQLESFLATLPDEQPVHFIGLGSNLLVRDGGIRGAVICTSALPREVSRLDEVRVRAAAGLPCTTLARRCARWKLGPAAFFAGIPGTVGGALAMNAGAFGGETWNNVESVTTIDRSGVLHVRPRSKFSSAYRTVSGAADEWFIGATFRFEPDERSAATAIKAMLRKRADTQPLGRPSAGSVFRNPPGNFAGRLIERAGLKGARVGGAVVSEKHANFIINTGSATAAEIERLIELLRSEVGQRMGVVLELEVRVLGEYAGEGA
ncbi:UDP-N-acetylmuramate dehydrogenase [Candidatus Rariloculus sp.]|uniref:UDP-N-acetylmuramate dehydrogenase n=1 Tax=Candidatus Rariloculus sp. TaxID=3101265 RepID=UPI003D0D2209